MAVKIKTRDPKKTDFAKSDIVINIKEGSLFYKSDLGLHKLEPTITVEETPDISKDTITITKSTDETFPYSVLDNSVTNDAEDSTSVTLKLSDFVGWRTGASSALSDAQEKHKVLRIENNRGFVEIGAFDTVRYELGNQSSSTRSNGIMFRSNRDFYFAHFAQNDSNQIYVGGGTNGGYRTIRGDLFLSPRGGNLASNDVANDNGIIQIETDIANTIIHGDLTVQSNTEDTTDNIGIGNIQADGKITSNNINEEFITLTSPDGTVFQITVSNEGDLEVSSL